MFRYIIGIDIGTSFSCAAYATPINEGIQLSVFEFLGNKGLIPSAVLYNQSGKCIAFGTIALKERQNNCLIQQFKMNVVQTQNIALAKFTIDPLVVYKDFLTYIRDELYKTLGVEFYKEWDELTEQGVICITHPAEKNKRIAEQIISIAEEVFKGYEIHLLDEASAVVQLLDQKRGFLTRDPKRILVVDSGGGTTDFSLANAQYNWLKKPKPLEIIAISSIPLGGRNIDETIYNLVEQKITKRDGKEPEPFRKLELLELIRIEKENYNWVNKQPFKVAEERISLTYNEIFSSIKPIIDAIIKHTMVIYKSKSFEKQFETIVLAGGNSRILILQEQFNNTFSPLSIKIQVLPDKEQQIAVAKGAALFAYNSNGRIKRRLAYDVGIKCNDRIFSIWRRGELFPINNPKSIYARVTKLTGELTLLFTDSNGSKSTKDIIIPVNSLNNNSIIMLSFDIDTNGYLRITSEFKSGKSEPFNEFLEKDLFKTEYINNA